MSECTTKIQTVVNEKRDKKVHMKLILATHKEKNKLYKKKQSCGYETSKKALQQIAIVNLL